MPSVLRTRLERVQVGQPQPLSPHRPAPCDLPKIAERLSAIVKQPVLEALVISKSGLAGDVQADPRVHGGPEKAVHQYSLCHYATWAKLFPEASHLLHRGSMGENLSTDEHDESNVFLGDQYRVGTALLQVSQPRRPCWKIDARFGVSGLAEAVQASGHSGWYFRVLECGVLQVGDTMELVSRPQGSVSLAVFWAIYHAPIPDPDAFGRLSAIEGLAPAWREKIAARLAGRPPEISANRLRGW